MADPVHRGGAFDWTLSPAKWGAVGVLALLGAGGLAWSIIRTEGGGTRSAAGHTGVGVPERPVADGLVPLLGDGGSVAGGNGGPSDVASRGAVETDAAPDLAVPSTAVPTSAAPPEPHVPAPQPVQPQPTIARRVDINSATEAELQLLPGIGPARARAIIDDRRINGRFRSVDDLDRVDGIGAGIIAGLREFARAG